MILYKIDTKLKNNFSWFFFEKSIKAVIGLITVTLISRGLGPNSFGVYSYALSFVLIFQIFIQLGLDDIMIKELVEQKNYYSELIGTSIGLRTISSILGLVVILILIKSIGLEKIKTNTILILYFGLAFQIFNSIESYFNGRNNIKPIFISRVFSSIGYLSIILILTNIGLTVFGVAIAFLLQHLINTALLLIKFNNRIKLNGLRFKTKTAKDIIKKAWPLMFVSISLSLHANIDQVLINHYLGNFLSGNYAASFQILSYIAVIAAILHKTLFPTIINSKQNHKNFINKFTKYYKLMFWFSLLISLNAYFFSDFFLNIIYGDEFTEVGWIFSLMCFRLIFSFVGIARNDYFISTNNTKHLLLSLLISLSINLFFTILLLPSYGINGVIVATYFSMFIEVFVFDCFFVKSRKNSKLLYKSIFSI